MYYFRSFVFLIYIFIVIIIISFFWRVVGSLVGVWYIFRGLGGGGCLDKVGKVFGGFIVLGRRVCILIFSGGIFEGLSRVL